MANNKVYSEAYFDGQKCIERYAPFSLLAPLTKHNIWLRNQVLNAIKNKERIFAKKRAEKIVTYLRPAVTLDVGTATGELVEELIEKSVDAWGAEGSKYLIDNYNEALKEKIVKAYTNKLPFDDNSFDVVSAFHVLEHIEEKLVARSLQEMARVSRQYLLFELPTTQNLWNRVDKTHISIFPANWWLNKFNEILPNWRIANYRSPNITRAMQITLIKYS